MRYAWIAINSFEARFFLCPTKSKLILGDPVLYGEDGLLNKTKSINSCCCGVVLKTGKRATEKELCNLQKKLIIKLNNV